jgi:hypothetical protein
MFNIPGNGEDRRKRAADASDNVRQCLIKNLVPRYLGVQHLTREDAKRQNTSFSIEFFGNNVTVIWDGMYLFIGKSSSHPWSKNTARIQPYTAKLRLKIRLSVMIDPGLNQSKNIFWTKVSFSYESTLTLQSSIVDIVI